MSCSSKLGFPGASYFKAGTDNCLGGAVASWFVRSTPDRLVRVRVLAGDIVLCSWARSFTLMITVPLSTQVYKWVPTNLMLGVTQGGVEILLVASCYRIETGNKRRPDVPSRLRRLYLTGNCLGSHVTQVMEVSKKTEFDILCCGI